jgi:carboxyl-terminal processing protease
MKKFLFAFLLIIPVSSFSQSDGASKIDELISYLKTHYVDTVNSSQMYEDALKGILKELDPHSYYLSVEELKQSNEPLQGNFEGVGIQFNIFHDTIMVVSPISGGPSEKVGIKSGDKIVKINDTLVAGVKVTNQDVYKKLRGKKGTKVNMKIMRRGEVELIEFTVTRDKIPVYSVDASYMAAPGVGYIKVNRFASTTMTEFKDAWRELSGKGAKDLILDLTDNSGGYLHAAVELADEFLASGEMIVYTEGRTSPRKDYTSTSFGAIQQGKLVVMIDEGSASASEIVSGAIQDHDRGIIVGRRSYGKGLVQNTYNFNDGSAVRLTTARYYTPSGRFIQKPYEGGVDKYYEDLKERYKNGELSDPDKIKFPDSLKHYTDNKRLVFGGGGIMPDLFIGIDTTMITPLLTDLNRKNIINEFCLENVDKNRNLYKTTYPTFEDFEKNFDVEKLIWADFVKFAESKEIVFDKKQLKKSQAFINMRIKAGFAQDLWGRKEFYRVWNTHNNVYAKAVEVIQRKSFKGVDFFE